MGRSANGFPWSQGAACWCGGGIPWAFGSPDLIKLLGKRQPYAKFHCPKAANVALGSGERGAETPLRPMSQTFADPDLRVPAISEIAGSPRHFTASDFPPAIVVALFSSRHSCRAVERTEYLGVAAMASEHLADNKALHEGANERIRLEPSQQIAKSASPSTCTHVSRSGRRTGVRGQHPTYFRAFSPWAA
jgi:hypothetical protein